MFILGFFWKKTTSNAALFATIGGFLFSIVFKFMPAFVDLAFLNPYGFSVPNASGIYEIPFIDRMGFVFLICVIGMYFISRYETRNGVKTHGLEIDKTMFKMSPSFTVGMLIILSILAALYTIFW
jgi:SSS family solute:Na+ symporter